MARIGGNPDIVEHGFKAPPGVKPRTAHFQIRISEELRDKLKAFSKDEIREALQRLVDERETNPTKPARKKSSRLS
jgi:hypothetical protein